MFGIQSTRVLLCTSRVGKGLVPSILEVGVSRTLDVRIAMRNPVIVPTTTRLIRAYSMNTRGWIERRLGGIERRLGGIERRLECIGLQMVRYNSSIPSRTDQIHERIQISKDDKDDIKLAAKIDKSVIEQDVVTGEAKSKPNLRQDIMRLARLAKPEVKLMVFAFTCLLVTSATSMSLPLFIGKVIDMTKDEPSETETIYGLAPTSFYTALAVLFTVGAVANFGRIYLLRTVGEKLVSRLRLRLFLKMLTQDSYFYDVGPRRTGMKTGDLILRLSSDTQMIAKTLSGNISDGARALISGMVGLSMMCFVSWKLTLCMSMIFPPLILMLTVYGRRVKALSRQVQEHLGLMNKVSEEKLNGLKTIQSFLRQKDTLHEFNREIKKIYDTLVREGKLSGIYYGTNGFLGNVTIIGLLVVGTKLIGMGEMTIGDLSSFMMYAVYTGSSVFGLGNFYTELMKGVGAAERVFELSDLKPKITTSLGYKVDSVHGPVEFKGVSFKYPSRMDQSAIFGSLDLSIAQGESVCIVGPSGSGKSTISQLLLRFYDPIDGVVTVNGHDISKLNLNDYRRQLGYVQQEPLLFSGTVRENITFGKPDATDDEIEAALRLSNAHTFVHAMPQGLDTVIGPLNSTQLSGGQKQRLLLARTMIRKPKIIILDEATSALDSISEEIVMRNLSKLHKDEGVTVISIAHRLSTIKNSERVVVLGSDGHILEDGKFAELYNNSSSNLNKLLKNHALE